MTHKLWYDNTQIGIVAWESVNDMQDITGFRSVGLGYARVKCKRTGYNIIRWHERRM